MTVRPNRNSDNPSDRNPKDPALAKPIAIVGMGCRLPGARNVQEYWKLLEGGIDAIRPIPSDRWDADEFYDPNPGTPGKSVLREGGFVEDIDKFDPYFFGISPREAVGQDPQQRLLLETVWQAMEDAGMRAEEMVHSRSGVFVGFCQNDYSQLVSASGAPDASIGGSGPPVASGRISTVFGFEGPSVTVDTACSSSLVATHLACTALQNRECDVAFAGGVNAVLSPIIAIGLSQGGMLSPDARCKAFDADANGFVRSEGSAVLALKRLEDAIADGDRIHAVIRGSAVSNDGACSPLMTPSRPGQVAALRDAYSRAHVDPADVDYVEAHGTGTKVGDPIEIGALSDVLGVGRPQDRRCKVGSSKTNIGHTEAAAGIAGLIKVVLAMRHSVIPASLHCHTLNPEIPWDEISIEVQREKTPWPDRGRPPLAGVNSFGISGTNAHVVIEGPPAPGQTPEAADAEAAATTPDGPQLLTFTGRASEDLYSLAETYRDFLRSDEGKKWTVAEICRAAGTRRSVMEHRLAATGSTHEELADALDLFAKAEQVPGLSVGFAPESDDSKPVFVFSGAGSQWPGMARELRDQEPVFAETLQRIDELVRKESGWSVIEEIDRPEEESRLGLLEFQQVVIFSVQVSLAATWRAWGVEPAAIVGHSLGEFAAAHVAGATKLEDAVRAVCIRSRLMARLSGKGGMLAVAYDAEKARELIAGHEDKVAVGVLNSPSSTVLSGDPEILAGIQADLDAQDVFCRMVKVDVASHSPQLEEIRDELCEALKGMEAQEAAVPLYSSLTGERMTGTEYGGDYWYRSARQPVLFVEAVEKLLAEGHTRFLEVSGHPVLAMPIRQTAEHLKTTAHAFGTMRRQEGGRAALLSAIGAMFAAGGSIDWDRLVPPGGRLADLPHFPWRRERFWVEGVSFSSTDRFLGHPFLQRHWVSAEQPGVHVWEADLNVVSHPFLAEHVYQDSALLPGAAYIEMALATSLRLHGDGPRVFKGVKVPRALFFPQDETRTIQITMADDKPGVSAKFRVHSRQGAQGSDAAEWALHAEGIVQYARLNLEEETREWDSDEALTERFGEAYSGDVLYEAINKGDLWFGDRFRGIRRIWAEATDSNAVFDVASPEALHDAKRYHIHPAFLDSLLQGYFSGTLTSPGGGSALPIGMREIQIRSLPDPSALYRGRSGVLAEEERLLAGWSDVYDADGRLIVREIGHEMRVMSTPKQHVEQWLYKMRWEETPLEQAVQTVPVTWVLLGSGAGAADALKAALEAAEETAILGPDMASFETREQAAEALREACKEISGQAALVYLEALDGPSNEELTLETIAASQKRICGGEVLLVQAMAEVEWALQPRLYVVTRGAQRVGGESEPVTLSGSCVLGLTRVVGGEHPAFRPLLIDMDPAAPTDDVSLLFQALHNAQFEKETALRDGKHFGLRLARLPKIEEEIDHTRAIEIADDKPESYKLETRGAGVVDNLRLRKTERRAPGPGEIEVRIAAAGLNFIDVLRCYGIQPGQDPNHIPFGMEASGRVVAVGEGVEGYAPGDEVVVLGGTVDGAAQAYVTVYAALCFKKPEHLTLEEAAAVFVVYQTVHHSLVDKAELGPGEIVLIHSAAGGVGLAAMEVAKQLGARIFATAGNDEKRALLRSMGAELVMDSHALDFHEEILEYTNGRGVDVVLNSLAGPAISKSLDCLAIGGRFVEIGKRDIYDNTQIGLWPFQKNLSYFAIDLLRLSFERPDLVNKLTDAVIEKLSDGSYKALPVTTFPVSQASDAFRHMAKGAHVGKVVLTFDENAPTVDDVPEPVCEIRSDATYLVTGGLGALGMLFAGWLLEKGAKHIVLTGRRGETPETAPMLELMRQGGADVRAVAADISKPEDVDRLIEGIRNEMPPLKGVIHSAVVLDDGIVQQLDWSRFEKVFAPKVDGSWLLHKKLEGDDLDFFSFYSSAASSIGSPGQGNYAAGNAFQDQLTLYRRAKGQAATGVNWGPWAEIGLAAAQANRGERVAAQGIESIPPRLGVLAFERLLATKVDQALVVPFNWKVWVGQYPEIALDPLYRDIASDYADAENALGKASELMKKLKDASPEEAVELIAAHLAEQVSKVLKVPESRLDPRISLSRFGLDSLMAVELKNRIEMSLPLTIAVVKLIDGPSLEQLTGWVIEELTGLSAPATSSSEAEEPADEERAMAAAAGVGGESAPEIKEPDQAKTAEGLSQSEVDQMLEQMLGEQDKTG